MSDPVDGFQNAIYHLEVRHDDGCPMLNDGKTCTCKHVDEELFTHAQWMNRQQRRKAQAEARKRKAH